jgi:hypothetical protein
MTKTYQVDIYDHSQVLHDGSSISWPLADGTGSLPALPYEAGDWILGNRGADTVYVSTDGTTLTFGASYDGSTFSGTGSDTTLSVMPYSGPYLSIAPGALNLEDEAFDNDIEILGVAGLVRDPNTSTVPISWTNGEAQIAGTNIVPGAVSYFQTTRNHHVRGHFVGGVFQLWNGATPAMTVMPHTSSEDMLVFVTDDGNWDGINMGAYRIIGPLPDFNATSGGSILSNQLVIASTGTSGPASTFPATPANAIITFTTLFPGAATNVSVAGAASLSAGDYRIRYCWTKSLTLDRSDGSTVTKTLETALSALVYQAGNSYVTVGGSGQIAFDVPPMPTDMTGFRLYMGTAQDQELLMASGYSYTPGGGTGGNGRVVVTALGTTAGAQPSYGFFAWPAGTNILHPESSHLLMKMGHLGGKRDGPTGNYTIHGFNSGQQQRTSAQIAEKAINGGQKVGSTSPYQDHIGDKAVHATTHVHSYTTKSGTTPVAVHKVAAADGSGGMQFDDPGMANPMTTQGDIIYGGASGAATRLGSPGDYAVLTYSPGPNHPVWIATSGSPNAGALVYEGGTSVSWANVGSGDVVLSYRTVAGDTIPGFHKLETDQMTSGSATSDQVPTADGSGGVAWQDQTGGTSGVKATDKPTSTTTVTASTDTTIYTPTIAANALTGGRMVRIKLYGRYDVGFAGTGATLKLKINGATVFSKGTGTTVGTNFPFFWEYVLTIRNVGGSGACWPVAEYLDNSNNPQQTVSTTTTAIDTTASNPIVITASVQDPSNIFRLDEAVVEYL